MSDPSNDNTPNGEDLLLRAVVILEKSAGPYYTAGVLMGALASFMARDEQIRRYVIEDINQ